MNFKDWKKVSEDAGACTLVHPKGHTMTIATKALPKILREQVKRLEFAQGGFVNPKGASDKEKRKVREEFSDRDPAPAGTNENFHPEGGRTPIGKMQRENNLRAFRSSKGPNLKGLAEGGEVHKTAPKREREYPNSEPRTEKGFWNTENGKKALDAQNKEIQNIRDTHERTFGPNGTHQIIKGQVHERKKLAEGTPNEPLKQDDSMDQSLLEKDSAQSQDVPTTGNHTPITINVNSQPSAPPAPIPAPPAPAAAPEPVAAAPLQKVDTGAEIPKVPAGVPNIHPNGTLDPSAVAKNEQTAIEAQKNIDISKGKAEAGRENLYAEDLNNNASERAELYQELKGHADDFSKYIRSNPINPTRYQENMSSGQKVSTAFGLFFGGLGTPFGGHNYAMDFLNKQIDRDIEAQKSRGEQEKTILGAYEHLYGEGVAANNMARVAMNDLYVHNGNKIAADLATPQAQQRALQFGAEKARENSKLMQDAVFDITNAPGYKGKGAGPNAGPASTAPEAHGASGNWNDKDGEFKSPPGLLHAGSEQMLKALQFTPKARDQIAEITRQFTQAQQADKALKALGETYTSLAKETNGVSGRIHRTLNPNAVAGAGAMAGAAVAGIPSLGVGALPGAGIGATIGKGVGELGAMATNTDSNRQYDSDKSAVLGYISSALKGTNIGSGQIQEIVDVNSPESGDTPTALRKKYQNIVDFVKNHTETSLLKTWHLTNE